MGKLFGKKRRDAPPAPPAPPAQSDVVTVRIETKPKALPAVDTGMATHIGTRDYQQDAAYVCAPAKTEEDLCFGVLCDGMGGMQEGGVASSEAVAHMANRIAELPPGADFPAFLRRAVESANEMMLCYNREHGVEAGTTLCAAAMRDGQLHWVSVGDSRIYILRGREMARLTRDHNFAIALQKMVEAGQITQQQADADPRREALVSYIGAPVLEELDQNAAPFALQSGDMVLLCSDGLTKSLCDDEIAALLGEGGGLDETARTLVTAAFDASPGGQDNTSVVLMRYHGAPEDVPKDVFQEPNVDENSQRSEEDEPGEM